MAHSSGNFKPAQGKFRTSVNKLKIGDVFWHKISIDGDDVANPKSDTAKDVRNNRKTKRLVVVLDKSPVQAVYLATFDKSKKLPGMLKDPTLWYPVNDATREGLGHYEPVETEPRLPGAQWVNVRKPHLVDDDEVERIGGFHFTSDVVAKIAAVLKARVP